MPTSLHFLVEGLYGHNEGIPSLDWKEVVLLLAGVPLPAILIESAEPDQWRYIPENQLQSVLLVALGMNDPGDPVIELGHIIFISRSRNNLKNNLLEKK